LWSLSFWLSHQNPAYIPPLPLRDTFAAHLMLLDLVSDNRLPTWTALTHFNWPHGMSRVKLSILELRNQTDILWQFLVRWAINGNRH
jgi:hypothetical protein